MTKRRRQAPDDFGDLGRVAYAWLLDEPLPPEAEMTLSERWDCFVWEFWCVDGMKLAVETPLEVWQRYRDSILPAWLAQYPGSRPARWWQHDAPVREPWMARPVGFYWKDAPDPATQLDYLHRHGLLLPSEERALAVVRATR